MKSGQSIDGVANRRRQAQNPQPPIQRTTAHKASAHPKHVTDKHQRRFSGMRYLVLPVFFACISIVGLLSQSVAELIIIGYGIAAIIRRIPSQRTFALGLAALFFIPITGMLGFINYAGAFSSYTFLFLMFGTICLGYELSRD